MYMISGSLSTMLASFVHNLFLVCSRERLRLFSNCKGSGRKYRTRTGRRRMGGGRDRTGWILFDVELSFLGTERIGPSKSGMYTVSKSVRATHDNATYQRMIGASNHRSTTTIGIEPRALQFFAWKQHLHLNSSRISCSLRERWYADIASG